VVVLENKFTYKFPKGSELKNKNECKHYLSNDFWKVPNCPRHEWSTEFYNSCPYTWQTVATMDSFGKVWEKDGCPTP